MLASFPSCGNPSESCLNYENSPFLLVIGEKRLFHPGVFVQLQCLAKVALNEGGVCFTCLHVPSKHSATLTLCVKVSGRIFVTRSFIAGQDASWISSKAW